VPRSAAALARALVDARNYTQTAYAHLTAAERAFPQWPTINPARWEVGHIAWFQEFWCRRHAVSDPRGLRTPSRLPNADAWWDSSSVPHATRWSLPLPDWDGLHAYLDATLHDTLDALARTRDGERYFFELALYHEDMHVEALLMTLQTLALAAPAGAVPVDPVAAISLPAPDIAFRGGMQTLGAARGTNPQRFAFDNEKWAHEVDVAPFALAARCVTNAEFLAFVSDDGYRRPEFWSSAGGAWMQGAGRAMPAYWRHVDGEWQQRWFRDWWPLAAGAPVMHVNAHEAEAYCAWAGRRLPSEAEWECAASALTGSPHDAHLDHAAASPVAAAGTGTGLAHMLGNVWEWTATPFAPYPGFSPDPYADYSAPWFGSHRVVRGGSFATRSRLVHPGFRNFYVPERADLFVGFRTCAMQH
jgi:iron(II)-dependent oxidoreductase